MTNTVALSIRIPSALAKKADDLLPWCETQPDLSLTGHSTRTEILRHAMLIGIDALERRRRRMATRAVAGNEPLMGA